MYATPTDVATHLGRPLSDAQRSQVDTWIGWLEADIAKRLPGGVDAGGARRAIVESIVAYMHNPENATQVTVGVDDGNVSRTYRSGTGRVAILPELWADLGWVEPARAAFAIRPHYVPDVRRAW